MTSLRDQDALYFQCDIETPETLLMRLLTKLVYGSLACSEDDANVATAGTAWLVHNAVVSRQMNKILMTSIEHAEIMVNTELSKRIDVGRKGLKGLPAVTKRPGGGNILRSLTEQFHAVAFCDLLPAFT